MSAGFSIEDLKSQISQSVGLAKPNQFMIQLPQIESFSVDAQELNLLCSATALPGRQIMSTDYAIGTTNRKIANGYAVTDLNLTFLVANNHIVRQYFEAWQAEAHDPVSRTIGYYDDYTYDVIISTVLRGNVIELFQRNLGGAFTKIPQSIRNKVGLNKVEAGIEFEMKKTFTCKVRECFPTTISEQPLSNAADGIMELSVQLSYSDFESEAGEVSEEGKFFEDVISGIFG